MIEPQRLLMEQALGQVALAALMAFALHTFRRRHRRRYLRYWASSWLALGLYVLAGGLVAPAVQVPGGDVARTGIALLTLLAGYLHLWWLMLGTWEIASGRAAFQRPARGLVVLGLLCVGTAVLLLLGLLYAPEATMLQVGLRSAAAAFVYATAATAVLSPVGRRPRAFGRRLMALALGAYAAVQLSYAVLILRPGPVPLAILSVGMFDLLAQALLALAMVIWLLGDQSEESLAVVKERERKERAQACVYRISAAVHAVNDLPELFKTIHASIGEVLPARNFYIALFHREDQTLDFPYFVDEHDAQPAAKPIGRGLTEYVLRTQEPLLATPEVFRSLVDRGEVELLFTNSVDWLGVPLLDGDEAIGVLAVQTYDSSVRLGPEDRDLLVFVSEQVAAAIAARRATDALRESETLLSLAMGQLPAVLWTTDEELRFTSSVGAGLAALGLEPDQVVGMPVAEYIQGDERVLRAHRRALAGGSASVDVVFGDRSYVVQVEPLHDGSSEVRGTVGIALDTTEERRAAARLRQVIDLVPHFIFAKDAEGRFLLANRALAEAHGTTPEGLLGKSVADLGVDPEEARHFIADDREVIRSGQRLDVPEERFTDVHGRVRYLQTMKIPFTFSESPALLAVAIDISERKAAEQAFLRAAKEESLSVLAGGVAHDFNNLLGAVLGHVSLTLAKLSPASPARHHAERAAETVERAADLTRQMLAYSGHGHFVIKPTDLGGLVRESLPLLAVALPKNVALETCLAEDALLVDADVGQIQQVLMNLVINGGEAVSAGGGTVTVSTGLRHVGPDDARFWRVTGQPLAPGPHVLLEVRDDGPGMDEDTVSRIFDPFFTTKFTGRGLGLAAVLGVMRGHKGGLHVESRPGEGTVFQLLFGPSDQAADEPEARGEASPEERLRLLLIDDEEIVREMVAEVLEHEGLDVVAAADGEEGLRHFGERGDGFDGVILDLSMPGLGGAETFAELVARRSDVPVVLSSGYDHAEAMRRFQGRSPAGFIQKPYRPAELLAEIRRSIHGRRADDRV